MDVAVIGGGVGGLAVAYNLVKNWSGPGAPPSVTVYEASDRFGGNGDTVHFSLGVNMHVEPPASYDRWADLGVNDFNKTAYVHIDQVMREIGYAGYKPLEDSTSYYTLDGSTAFASGNAPFCTSPMTLMPEALSKAADAFMTQAAHDAQNPAYAQTTVREYIETVFCNNPAYDKDVGPLVIYPRINGMYFTDEVAPSELPLKAVMHYYQIQEGAGGAKAERMYFVDGASAWIDALTAYMVDVLQIKLVPKFRGLLFHADGSWSLYNGAPGPAITGDPIHPDVVVVATHADDALKLIQSGASTQVMSCLARVRYLNGISVAHTFAGMMPPDYNAWCTYNILIHQDASYLKPYTISYVCNRHQNDAAEASYDHFGLPQFFITCNPPVPIPSKYILTDAATGKPAIANLRHNVFDCDCLSAQAEILTSQGQNNLYFAGGWTLGAGLHEECWIQGINIAHQIATGEKVTDHHYDVSRGPDKYAPKYLRRLLGRD